MTWKVFAAGLTPEMLRLMEIAAEERRPHPIFHTARGQKSSLKEYIGKDGLRAAQEFTDACALDPGQSEVLKHAVEILPAGFFTVLVSICGMRLGLEVTEKSLGWPARSAKLVLAMALRELIHREVV